MSALSAEEKKERQRKYQNEYYHSIDQSKLSKEEKDRFQGNSKEKYQRRIEKINAMTSEEKEALKKKNIERDYQSHKCLII